MSSCKSITLLLVCLIFISAKTLAEPNSSKCRNGKDYFQCVKYIRNYDADTVTFEIGGVHELLGHQIPIRVRDVDTPELRTKNRCEKSLGYQAKDFVAKKISTAKRIDLVRCERGKYFRLVCDVLIDGASLSKMLVRERFAYSYDGGTKSEINWCNYRTKKRLPSSEITD